MTDKHATSPIANLLVIHSKDIHRAVEFYRQMGMAFDLHSHGKGPEHYASEVAGFVFEIYPSKDDNEGTSKTRIGFKVDDVDSIVALLKEIEATIVREPADTEWGRRAVAKDFDGHTVELVTPINHEKNVEPIS